MALRFPVDRVFEAADLGIDVASNVVRLPSFPLGVALAETTLSGTTTVACAGAGTASFAPQPAGMESLLVANDAHDPPRRYCAGTARDCPRGDVDCPRVFVPPFGPDVVATGSCKTERKTVSDTQLATAVSTAITGREANLEAALFRFDQCFSGGFIDDLSSTLRPTGRPWAVATAARHDESSQMRILGRPATDLSGRNTATTLGTPVGGRDGSLFGFADPHTTNVLPIAGWLNAFFRARGLDHFGPFGTGVEHPQYASSGDVADALAMTPPTTVTGRAILFAGEVDDCSMWRDLVRTYSVLRASRYPRPAVDVFLGDGSSRIEAYIDQVDYRATARIPFTPFVVRIDRYLAAWYAPPIADAWTGCELPPAPRGVSDIEHAEHLEELRRPGALKPANAADLLRTIENIGPLLGETSTRIFIIGDDHGSLRRRAAGGPAVSCAGRAAVWPSVAAMLPQPDGASRTCAVLPRGKRVSKEVFVVTEGTCLAVGGSTIIEAPAIVVEEGGALVSDGTLRSLTLMATNGPVTSRGRLGVAASTEIALVSRTGNVDVGGEAALQAGTRVKLDARAGSVQLSGGDAALMEAGNVVDITAKTADGSVDIRRTTIVASRINIATRANVSGVLPKAVHVADGARLTTRPSPGGSLSDITIDATGSVIIETGATIESGRNVKIATARSTDDVRLRSGATLVARNGAGRIDLSYARGGVTTDGRAVVSGTVAGTIVPAIECGGPGALTCPVGQVCNLADATCAEGTPNGLCEPDAGCPLYLDEVCGCDGVTYPNDCERVHAGAALARRGACDAQ